MQGPERYKALVVSHSSIGFDQTDRFNNKSKTACWKTFLSSSNITLEAFSRLGEKWNLPSLESLEVLIYLFACLLYKENLNEINTLAMIHWFMFSKYQYNSENLPPTSGALKYKAFYCHYVTINWKRAIVTKQNLPSLLVYGWEIVENNIMSILTDNITRPVTLIELSAYFCKTVCKTNRF